MESKSDINQLRKIIGHNIRLLRKGKGLGQVELGKALGYRSTGTISQIETGTRGLQLASVMKFADFLGVHPAVLISPVSADDYNDLNMLSKVIRLIELKREKPDVVQPLLAAINGMLDHLPAGLLAH